MPRGRRRVLARRGEPASVEAVCLDVDNGPDWLVTPGNGRLYAEEGLRAAAGVLVPGGVLAIWSASRSAALAARLAAHVTGVETLEVPAGRGEPDIVLLGTAP